MSVCTIQFNKCVSFLIKIIEIKIIIIIIIIIMITSENMNFKAHVPVVY